MTKTQHEAAESFEGMTVRLEFLVVGGKEHKIRSVRRVLKEEMSKPYLDKLAAEMVGSVLERVFNER